MKPIQFSTHARFEMQRRGITDADVEAVVQQPEQRAKPSRWER